jgi:DNA repair protein SbcD/Mre11
MRLIHTADIHLDAGFASPGMPPEYGSRRRQALRDVFHEIVAHTRRVEADGLLIAGDLFELDRVTPDTVAFLKSEFESLGDIRVFIAPGNHDPHVVQSPYARSAWPANVTLFEGPAWQTAEYADLPLAIHGFGFDGPDISRNPFGNLQIPRNGRMHVAVAHGSEMGSLPPDKGAYAPFTAASAAAHGLAYLALGHYHATREIPAPFGTVMYYAGSPEGRHFGEQGLHYFLDVTLGDDAVAVTPVVSSRCVYVTESIDCTGFDSAYQAVEALRTIARGHDRPVIGRVVLRGASNPAWHGELPTVREAAGPEFAFLELEDRLEPEEDFDQIARDDTSMGAFARHMNEAVAGETDPARRRMLVRAREVGMAAYRNQNLPINGLGRG